VETIIFGVEKNNKCDNIVTIVYPRNMVITSIDASLLVKVNRNTWTNDSYNIYASKIEISILQKVEAQSVSLESIADFSLGITPYDKYKGHTEDVIKARMFHASTKIDETYKPLIGGENLVRYYVDSKPAEYIKYGTWLGAIRQERFFTESRIIVRQIVSGKPPRIYAGYTDKPLYYSQIGFGVIAKKQKDMENKYLLCVLNSQLITFYHKYKYLDLEKDLFQKILIANCKDFPIKPISRTEQEVFVTLADKMLKYNGEIRVFADRFVRLVQSNFPNINVNKKLEMWYGLSFGEFRKELGKQKIVIPIKELMDWQELFENNSIKAKQLVEQLSKTDKEIDQLIYQLYELTPEEIVIVEGRS